MTDIIPSERAKQMAVDEANAANPALMPLTIKNVNALSNTRGDQNGNQ